MQRTVIELLALKLSGEATFKDLEELKKLMAEQPDSIYYDEALTQIFQHKEKEEDLTFQYNRHRLRYQDKLVFAEQTVSAFNQFKSGKYLIAACSMLFILSLSSILIFNQKKSADLIYNAQIISGTGVRKSVLLPDGTKVWLNANSKIFYNKEINNRDIRQVKLVGEAFFDVAHSKNHPFIIAANKISIRVLGTAFNVRAYPNDKKTEATLLRGSIELSVNDRRMQKILLKPAQKFEMTDGQSPAASEMVIRNVVPLRVGGKEYTEEISWIDNQMIFENETLEELKPKLEKWFKIKLEIRNKEINAYHFTGVFTQKEDLNQALTAMQLIKHFNFKIKGHDVIIY